MLLGPLVICKRGLTLGFRMRLCGCLGSECGYERPVMKKVACSVMEEVNKNPGVLKYLQEV